MIFVVLGTQKFQFNRLLQQLDKIIEQGNITESVFAQIGNSDYEPKYMDFVRFLDAQEFQKKMQECAMLITHSGAGTIISGLNCHKPVIVIPRLAKYGEHVDDHQVEIAQSFSKMNYVLLCEKIENLEALITKAKRHSFAEYVSNRQKMIDTIVDYLETI